MSYDSPIEIAQKMQTEYEMDVVNNVLKCIQSYEINIDKDELIKALEYDRQQYEKGYKDGVKEAKEFVKWYKERLMHIQALEKELLDDAMKPTYQKLFASHVIEYRKGTTDMLERLLLHIDNDFERFLDERK